MEFRDRPHSMGAVGGGGTPLRIKSQAFSMEIDLVVRDACSTVHLKNLQTTNRTDNLNFSI